MISLSELRALADAAQQGEWKRVIGEDESRWIEVVTTDGRTVVATMGGLVEQEEADAAYIAALPPEVVRALIDALTEACLHQGLPLDTSPDRIAAHFRANRELREAVDALAPGPESEQR